VSSAPQVRPSIPPDVFRRTIVIIPAYNEAGNIAAIVSGIRSDYPEARVVVIDDGSSDRTREFAQRAGAVVLSHPTNLGYGVALQTGYKYALNARSCDYVVQIDGDGQHDYREIPRLLEPIVRRGADIVIGSRFIDGRPSYRIGLRRKWGIFFFRVLYRALAGNKVNDVTSGMKALRKSVVEKCIRDDFPYHYPDTNVLLLHSRNGFRIAEVPSAMRENRERKSMHGSVRRQLFYFIWMLLAIWTVRAKTKGRRHAS